MQIRMQTVEQQTLTQMGEFLRASAGIHFAGQNRAEVYAWVEATLIQQEYVHQGKPGRGTIRAYLSKVTGRSLPQITRLIRQYRQAGQIQVQPSRRRRFAVQYTEADVTLLVEVDRAHQRLSGPATRRIFEREFRVYGQQQFERLAGISVSHLYNLRQRASYRRRAAELERTRPVSVSIGERRRPDPRGQPGYLRIDSVHQGDWEGQKGVYHINAVDAVTQWEVLGCTPQISEAFLEPVLEAMLHQFPFRILGLHADNGSEFINGMVVRVLKKLLVGEFTKSRANRSQDNALVEGKNGAVVRKHMGYGHIPGQHAEQIQRFYLAQFNVYLNFHRPCGFATVQMDERGKRQRIYKAADYATPYEKLKSLPEAARYLKEGICFEQLDRIASSLSDTQYAQRMTEAKVKLLCRCKVESPFPPQW